MAGKDQAHILRGSMKCKQPILFPNGSPEYSVRVYLPSTAPPTVTELRDLIIVI